MKVASAILAGATAIASVPVSVVAVPPLVTPVPIVVASAASDDAEETYEINLNFGDIILQSATGEQAAEEFLRLLETPQAERRIRTLLRGMVERMK